MLRKIMFTLVMALLIPFSFSYGNSSSSFNIRMVYSEDNQVVADSTTDAGLEYFAQHAEEQGCFMNWINSIYKVGTHQQIQDKITALREKFASYALRFEMFRNMDHIDSFSYIYNARYYISFISRDGNIYRSFELERPNYLCWLQNSNELLDLLNQTEEQVTAYIEKEPIDERIHRSYKTALERLEDQK